MNNHPNTKRDFDKDAAAWDDNPARVKLAADVAAAIASALRLTPEMDVLDFGCGTGLLTLRIQPFVRAITGVDSSRGMLDVLKGKIEKQRLANVKTRCLDITKDEVLDGRYHLVVSSMTFHHIQNIAPLLDQFYKVLVPTGLLAVADLDPEGGRFHENPTGVFHSGFDRAALRQAFRAAGFEDIRDLTAATREKPVAGGGQRAFSIFLMTGRKKP